ncbi:hypothetical protein BSN81_16740, partial [Acinetobacter baylyi]
REDQAPKDGADLSGGTQVSLALRLCEAPKRTVGAVVGGGGVSMGLRIPQMEASRERNQEADGG